MSIHSCNDLCDLDDRFHEIQKYEVNDEPWSEIGGASKEEMRQFLYKKIGDVTELIKKLDA